MAIWVDGEAAGGAGGSSDVTETSSIDAETSTYPVAAPSGSTMLIGTSEVVIPKDAKECGVRFKLSAETAPDVDVEIYAFDRGDNGEWLELASFALEDLELEDDSLYFPLFSDVWKHAAVAVRMILNAGAATMDADVIIKTE